MANEAATIVQRLWNYCSVLRDDGVSYGDYVEQLTYLLFLKMADETKQLKHLSPIPEGLDWQALCKPDGDALELQYKHTLTELGKLDGALGIIFKKAQNRIQDPAKLKRLIELISGETWSGMDIDIKGEIYEGLLQKNAEDVKGGAGQYFTPRSLIKALVEVMNPQPKQTIHDPACGTGGFFLAAHDYLSKRYQMDRDQKKFLKLNTFSGCDIVDNVGRLCVMNLFLHGVGGDDSLVDVRDSLLSTPTTRFDMVMTNPPFGKKSSITIVNEEGKADREAIVYERQDFWATTSNKQLNFLQHVRSLLKVTGRAAVVVPDNVLFEGGAGETVRRKLLAACDVHTLLRLPTGIFYAQGVKANVLFFDNKPASETPWTSKLSQTTQVKLLRFLQERTFRRIGGSKNLAVDVRIIAATNKNLVTEMSCGRFREDLYYRLSGVNIHVPPLRERKADISLLAKSFLQISLKGSIITLDQKVIKILQRYEWPGNVRELQSFIQRLVIIAPGKQIDSKLVASMLPRKPDDVPTSESTNASASEIDDLGMLERATIIRVLSTSKNQVDAMKRLGISESTLRRKLREHLISRVPKPKQRTSNQLRKNPIETDKSSEAKLLAGLKGMAIFTTGDALRLLGDVSIKTVIGILNSLIQHKIVTRIQKGIYQILETG